ncbi:hypothetical protein EK904_012275, partial [Melospiza melodia maxima]
MKLFVFLLFVFCLELRNEMRLLMLLKYQGFSSSKKLLLPWMCLCEDILSLSQSKAERVMVNLSHQHICIQQRVGVLSHVYLAVLSGLVSRTEGSRKHFFVRIALNSVKASVCAFQKCSRLQLWEEGEGRCDLKYSSEFIPWACVRRTKPDSGKCGVWSHGMSCSLETAQNYSGNLHDQVLWK